MLQVSDLATKKDFISLKPDVDKLDINKFVNVSTSLNNLKAKVYGLDIGKSKTVPVELKKLSGVVANQVVKNTKFNTLKTKINSFGKKVPNATTLIHINQYNTDKQKLEKQIGDVDKKCQIRMAQWIQLFLIQKLAKLRAKYRIRVV